LSNRASPSCRMGQQSGAFAGTDADNPACGPLLTETAEIRYNNET